VKGDWRATVQWGSNDPREKPISREDRSNSKKERDSIYCPTNCQRSVSTQPERRGIEEAGASKRTQIRDFGGGLSRSGVMVDRVATPETKLPVAPAPYPVAP